MNENVDNCIFHTQMALIVLCKYIRSVNDLIDILLECTTTKKSSRRSKKKKEKKKQY